MEYALMYDGNKLNGAENNIFSFICNIALTKIMYISTHFFMSMFLWFYYLNFDV